MVELVDTLDLGSSAARCGGSSPPFRTSVGHTMIIGLLHLAVVIILDGPCPFFNFEKEVNNVNNRSKA